MKTAILSFGLAAALAAQTHVNGGRTIEGPVNFCADSAPTDTYACSFSPAITAYVTGAVYHFRANTANSGAATINFNGLGAKAIRKNRDQDLADNDIKAGQLVSVMYDGADMQMLSQTGNAAAGGGGGGGSAPTLIATAGVGYWSPFDGGSAFITPNTTDRDLRIWQVVLPFRATFGKVGISVATGSGTACPGGTCGFVAGLYDSACANLLTWGRATSGGSPDIATTGAKWISLTTAVTLDAGVYFIALASDSPALTIYARDVHGQFGGIINGSAPRFGVGSNRATGNGASLSLPATCGTINPSGFQMPAMQVWER